MTDIVYGPRNYLGHYCAAIQVERSENEYQVYLLGYDYDQSKGENVVGKEVRGGCNRQDFWFLLGTLPFEVVFGPNYQVEFKRRGRKISFGELVAFLDKESSFRSIKNYRQE